MIRYDITCQDATAEQLERASAAARSAAERVGVDPLDAAAGFAAHERWDRSGFADEEEPTEKDRDMMDAYFSIIDAARASLSADGLPGPAVHWMTMDLVHNP
ncbi:MAG: hypothetical protein EOO27_01055 [Comamonadaceae bacterium]|nr:MAG: hypothetical protein EOO27_01055 [Comamonadaceae bacterium]